MTDTPKWKVWAGVAFIVLWVVILAIWPTRLYHDFYPVDQGVAANVLASFVIFSFLTVAAAILWPPFRRGIHRVADQKLAEANRELHEKLDRNFHASQHIAKHNPNIPDIGKDGHTDPDWVAPKKPATKKS